MDLFKLFFNHDQRLDNLANLNANKTEVDTKASLQDFMAPTPTFSKFYITGTLLEDNNEKFGIDTLTKYDQVLEHFCQIFADKHLITPDKSATLFEALKNISIGEAVILSNQKAADVNRENVFAAAESKTSHEKDELRDVLLDDRQVIFKEQARNGFDLHLFSNKNIYPQLFHAFKPLVDKSFRFFSINSKRMHSEKHFYFETWTLDNPPHGAEEVFEDTLLRSK